MSGKSTIGIFQPRRSMLPSGKWVDEKEKIVKKNLRGHRRKPTTRLWSLISLYLELKIVEKLRFYNFELDNWEQSINYPGQIYQTVNGQLVFKVKIGVKDEIC